MNPNTNDKKVLRNNFSAGGGRQHLGLDRVQYYFAVPYDAVAPNCSGASEGRDICVKPIIGNNLKLPTCTFIEKHKYASGRFEGEIN